MYTKRSKSFFFYTYRNGFKLPISDNILERNFVAIFPGEKWVSDTTYLNTDSGWLYLTVVIDMRTGTMGWSIAEDLAAKQVAVHWKWLSAIGLPVRGSPICHPKQPVALRIKATIPMNIGLL